MTHGGPVSSVEAREELDDASLWHADSPGRDSSVASSRILGRVGRKAAVGTLNPVLHRERIHSGVAPSEFGLFELVPRCTLISRRVPAGASV